MPHLFLTIRQATTNAVKMHSWGENNSKGKIGPMHATKEFGPMHATKESGPTHATKEFGPTHATKALTGDEV
jgi:hypothetical protein